MNTFVWIFPFSVNKLFRAFRDKAKRRMNVSDYFYLVRVKLKVRINLQVINLVSMEAKMVYLKQKVVNTIPIFRKAIEMVETTTLSST